MKCGNCGRSHNSVDEVRSCHGLAPGRSGSPGGAGSGSRKKTSGNGSTKLSKAASATIGPSSGNHSAPGTVTSYGTGLVHAAGAVEFDSREECEWCGAKIASGQMHDC